MPTDRDIEATYRRVRAALCDEHTLLPPYKSTVPTLDHYAMLIAQTVIEARNKKRE